MSKIIMTRGLPASGKSTWAKEMLEKHPGKAVRINKDDMRGMFHDGKHSKGRERLVKSARDAFIETAIELNPNAIVIIDDTNFHPPHEVRLRQIAAMLGADFEVNDTFLQVSLEECIRRDAKRESPVGRNAILQMYNQYLRPTYEYTDGLPEAFLLDMDGTAALFEGNPYGRDFMEDKPNVPVLQNIVYPAIRDGLKCIILSGRNGKFKGETFDWIFSKTSITNYELHMRNEKDNRADFIVKEEMYQEFVYGKYNIKFVVDDRLSVCRLWYSLGLYVICVNQGLIEF